MMSQPGTIGHPEPKTDTTTVEITLTVTHPTEFFNDEQDVDAAAEWLAEDVKTLVQDAVSTWFIPEASARVTIGTKGRIVR